jgi:hypothetical protein
MNSSTLIPALPPDLQAIIIPALNPNGGTPTTIMLYERLSELTREGARWVRDAARAGFELIPTPDLPPDTFAIYTTQDNRLVGAWVYNPVTGHIGSIRPGMFQIPTRPKPLDHLPTKQEVRGRREQAKRKRRGKVR